MTGADYWAALSKRATALCLDHETGWAAIISYSCPAGRWRA